MKVVRFDKHLSGRKELKCNESVPENGTKRYESGQIFEFVKFLNFGPKTSLYIYTPILLDVWYRK